MSVLGKWRLWHQRCSTCGQRMTSLPCSRSPETGRGFHTAERGCLARWPNHDEVQEWLATMQIDFRARAAVRTEPEPAELLDARHDGPDLTGPLMGTEPEQ